MIHIDPYERLANAIIELAVKDYVKAIKSLKRKDLLTKDYQLKSEELTHLAAWRDKVQCEKFFLSDYFTILTKVDGEVLIHDLREVVD